MSNVVVVSGESQRDSAIHVHVSILPPTCPPPPSRLPHNLLAGISCHHAHFIFWPFFSQLLDILFLSSVVGSCSLG